jgi:hypothetical protein
LLETIDTQEREEAKPAAGALAAIRAHRGEATFMLLLTAVLVASVVWRPPDDGGVVLCLFRNLTGLPCVGCGLTRSFCALAKGEAARAFAFHALGPALFAAACVYWVRGVAFFAGRRTAVARFDAAMWRWRIPLVALVLLCATWAVEIAALGMEGHLDGLVREGLLYRIATGNR